jgi:hypothetical protein
MIRRLLFTVAAVAAAMAANWTTGLDAVGHPSSR